MLRTLVLTLTLVAAPSLALADDFSASAVGMAVEMHDGRAVGQVERVIRDSSGRIVGAEVSGLDAPGDAPASAREELVASTELTRLPAQAEFATVQQASNASGADRSRSR